MYERNEPYHFDIEAQEQELKFIRKLGAPTHAGATEADLDIAQVGAYTLYGADPDRGFSGQYGRSAHCMRRSVPIRCAVTTVCSGAARANRVL